MKRVILILVAISLSACASTDPLLPREQRRDVIISDVNASRDEAYARALRYAVKNWPVLLANPILLREDSRHHAIIQGETSCKVLNGMMKEKYGSNDKLHFNIDLSAKTNRVRLSFEDLVIKQKDGSGKITLTSGSEQITSIENLEKVKACTKAEAKNIIKAINDDSAENW